MPERTGRQGDTEYLSYSREETFVLQDFDYDESWFGSLRLLRPDFDVHLFDYRCEATFALRDGTVQAVEYSQGHDILLCHDIVADCLPPAPAGR